MIKQYTIAPSSALAFSLSKGQSIKVTDPEGQQVSDFVALCAIDKREKFDQDRTRVNNWSNLVGKGTILYSNQNNPIMEVLQDTVGVHDILFPCCNSYVYENIFHVASRSGCFENLAKALSGYGVEPHELPNPLNIFMNTFLNSDTGEIGIRTAPSKPGDSITLLALKDLIVAATACADDLSDCNAKRCKPIRIEINDA